MNPLQKFWQGLVSSTALSSVAGRVFEAFDIGRNGRRLAAIPNVTIAINTLIQKYGRTTTARSRYLCRNNPYATAAKETFVAALIGYGIKPSTLKETVDVKNQVHDDWNEWCTTSDADGLTDFYGQQALAASELFEAGEVFGVFVPAESPVDGQVPLQVRLVPSEMLPYENYSTEPVGATGNYIQMGIEFSAQGTRVAYHFLTENPTDITKINRQWKRVRIPAADVMHVFRPVQVGQVRGIPHTLAALVTTAMLDLYDDAELERKRVAALFAAFVTKPDPTEADNPLGNTIAVPAAGPLSQVANGVAQAFTLQPGVVVDLLPGEDIKFSTPADVGSNYDTFEYRMLCRAAAGFGVPYASMTGDLKAANYGSIRAGLVQFRRRIETMQWGTVIHQLLRPVWLRWLNDYTYEGLAPWPTADWLNIKLRRQHQKVKWLCPRWDWVDPLKDAQAEKLMVDNGFKARHDTVEETGNDPDETDQRIEDSQTSAEQHGLELNTGAVPPVEDTTTDPGDGTSSKPQEKPSAS